MQSLLEKMLFKLQLPTYAKTNPETLHQSHETFFKTCDKTPSTFTKEDIENFLHSMIILLRRLGKIGANALLVEDLWRLLRYLPKIQLRHLPT